MLRSAGLVALVTLLTACGDEPEALEPAPLAEVCGAAGPFQLLALAPDERVDANSAPVVVGERLLFLVGTGHYMLQPDYPPEPGATKVYAVGPCGEEPVVVGQDVQFLYEDSRAPGLTLGCKRDSRDLVRLDPTGVAEPVLLAAQGCFATFTKHGLLKQTSTEDDLVFAEFFPLVDPSGPNYGAPVPVADPVPGDGGSRSSVQLLPDEVLLLEADGALVSRALPDLTRTVEQSGVVRFVASRDGRYLLYQVEPSTNKDPNAPIGLIYIRDRSEGVSLPIGNGSLHAGSPNFLAPGFARVVLHVEVGRQRLITLPDFNFLDAPPGHDIQGPLGDGRWLTSTRYGGPWFILDPAGEVTLVTAQRGQGHSSTDQYLHLLLGRNVYGRAPSPLVRFFFDGREPQMLAGQADARAVVRADGRVLTMASIGDDWLGELTLVDPDTGTAQRIDDRVVGGTGLARWRHPSEPDTIVYGVVDGERSGVWLARPAPRE